MPAPYSQRIHSSYVVYVCVLLLLICVTSGLFVYVEWAAVRQHTLSSEQQLAQLAANNLSHLAGRTVTHVNAMRSAIENAMAHPQFSDISFAARLHALKDSTQIASEISTDFKLSLLVAKSPTQIQPDHKPMIENAPEDMVSALHFIDIAKAAHDEDKVFQWSYYYDRRERFAYIYPAISETDFLKSTKASTNDEVLELAFKSVGTRLWRDIEKANNQANKLLWRPAYLDMAGKGMMISLLGPVYTKNTLQGGVGADITLLELNENLKQSPLGFGRALLLDQDDVILADTAGRAEDSQKKLTLTDIFGVETPVVKIDTAFEKNKQAYWLKLTVKDTPWHLMVNVSDTELQKSVQQLTANVILMIVSLILFFIGAAVWLHKKYTHPAILLTVFLEQLKENPQQHMPAVPEKWRAFFLRSAEDEQERLRYLNSLKQDAQVLEQRVQERTIELKLAYADLEKNRDELDFANSKLLETLATLESTQHQLVQTEKLAALGKLVAGISHVLNTPIGNAVLTITTTLDEARARAAELESGSMKKSNLMAYFANTEHGLQLAQKNLDKAAHVINDLKQLSQEFTNTAPDKFDLIELVNECKQIFSSAFNAGGHSLRLEAQDVPFELVTYRQPLIQVLSLLIQNSLTHGFANRRGGEIAISLTKQETQLKIVYLDNGCGMEANQLGHLFDPFYTSHLGQGTSGLGAYVIYSLITGALRGTVNVASTVGAGLRYEILLSSARLGS